MKHYTAYLFDVDGTLLDTTELIYRSFVYTLHRFADKEITRETAVRHMGLPLRDQIETYLGPMSDERYGEIAGAHMEHQLRIYPDFLALFPGVVKMLALLRERGARIAAVTSRRMHSLNLYLKEMEIDGFFHARITPESTKRHKPHPEPALKALELLGAAAGETVFVGDSEFDMRCGAAAGVDTAFAAWGNEGLLPAGASATCVLESPLQLCAHTAAAAGVMHAADAAKGHTADRPRTASGETSRANGLDGGVREPGKTTD